MSAEMDLHTAPHFESSALITIDTQQDVLDRQPLEVPGTSAIVPRLVELCDAFRAANRPIVHIVRLYRPDGTDADPSRRTALESGAVLFAPGSPGSQLANGLTRPSIELDADLLLAGGVQVVGPSEVIIFKPRWGAFFRTPLDEYLRSQEIDTVVIGGCNFPNCPRATAYEASERDYRVAVAHDAMSRMNETHAEELGRIDAYAVTSADVVAALQA